MAKESGTSLNAYETTVEHMKMAKGYNGPTDDNAGSYGVVRMESGLNYEDKESKGM